MEWIRKVLNKKAFCVVFQSFFVVSTLVITTLSLISFVYYVTSTEYKFEKGYIIKVNSNITNFEKCSKFNSDSFDYFTRLTDYSHGVKYMVIIEFCISTIAALIIQGYIFISTLREYKAGEYIVNDQASESTAEAKNQKIKNIVQFLQCAFMIILQPGTFVVTIINYSKPCVRLLIAEEFLLAALMTFSLFFVLLICPCGLVLKNRIKHGVFDLCSPGEVLGKKGNFFTNMSLFVILSYTIISIVLFFANLWGSVTSIRISVINGATFIISIIANIIKSCSKSCCC